MRIIKYIMFTTFSIAILAFVAVWMVIQLPQFGSKPSGAHLKKISESPQHNGEVFENADGVKLSMDIKKIGAILKAYMHQPDEKKPDYLPIVQAQPSVFHNAEDSTSHLTWFGHSAFLLELGTLNILLDPMLGEAAAPFSFQVRRFSSTLPLAIEDLPKIDAVVFSHDHYDHLDHSTVLAIKDNVEHFFVPLGLKSHLVYWGVDSTRITEMDWWEEAEYKGLTLACTPSQHFSGRSLNDRGATLWCSWVIKSKDHSLYFSGDSGYFGGFRTIGEKYGPFDVALIECGQYHELWKEIHMLPEESARAAVDLGAKAMVPIHWGMFELALHSWTEPVERLSKEALKLGMPVSTPRIGQRLGLQEILATEPWWESI